MEVTRRHPLSQALGNLIREPVFQRVQLRGLSSEDVGRFVEITAGTSPSAGLVEAVHTRTEGNPLFVGEIIKLLSDEEIRGERGLNTRIPDGVRDAIGRRLDRLSDLCNQVLTAASVIGRGFSLSVLGRLFKELSQDQILEVLEESLEARMIEGILQAAGQYQFTHALVADTLLEELSLMGRVRMHARIAEALEGLYGSDIQAHAAELAHHFTQAEAVLGNEKLARYSAMAGETALSNYAYDEALAHFERAFSAKQDQPMDAETAEILFGLGRAQAAALEWHRMDKAVATLSRAFDYYVEEEDVSRAIAVAQFRVLVLPGVQFSTHMYEKALALVSPNSHQEGRVLYQYIVGLGNHQRDYEGTQDALRRTLSIARREKDTVLEMQALGSGGSVDHQHLRLQDSADKYTQVVGLARRLNDPAFEFGAHFMVAANMVSLGDSEQARIHLKSSIALEKRLHGHNSYRLIALGVNQWLATLQGDWATARDLIDQGLSAAPDHTPFLYYLPELEWQVGEFDQGKEYLERFLDALDIVEPGLSQPYAVAVAAIGMAARYTGDTGRFSVGEKLANAVLSSQYAVPSFALIARIGVGLMAVQQGNIESAAEQYAALSPHRGTILFTISNDRLLGLLARTMGRLDDASEHFEDALIFCQRAGYRPEYAWTCYDYADALFDRNGPGDRARATSILTEVLDISTELGMRPLMERVTALQNQVEKHPQRKAPTKRNRHALTYRQLQVLNFITQGMTNNEIAGELVLCGADGCSVISPTSTVKKTPATGLKP